MMVQMCLIALFWAFYKYFEGLLRYGGRDEGRNQD